MRGENKARIREIAMVNERYQVEVVHASYYKKVISCQKACPVHTDAQDYVNTVAGGNYDEGYI